MLTSSTSEFSSSSGAVMIRVPAGSFVMGSPEAEDGHLPWERQRDVTLASDFFLGKHPITQDQYAAVVNANPTEHQPIGDAPVTSVTWDSACEYCQRLTQLDRDAGILPNDWQYRLPTEAEWEYACRAGSLQSRYGELLDVAWFHDNADQVPHAVGQKTPNDWGFHDMLGNVWEWCQDWFYEAHSRRSVRGGSYFNSARCCRSAARWGLISFPGRYVGFRVLAARIGPFELSPPIVDLPSLIRPLPFYEAIDKNDFDAALRIVADDPEALESPDDIPPPLHCCVYDDKPEWIEWLLDHGADIERLEQDYGASPLSTAVVMRQKRIIPILVARGARTEGVLNLARNGLAGAYEGADATLDREGYRDIIELLISLGIED